MSTKNNILSYITFVLFILLAILSGFGHVYNYDISFTSDIYRLCIIFCVPFLIYGLIFLIRSLIVLLKKSHSQHKILHIISVILIFAVGITVRIVLYPYIISVPQDNVLSYYDKTGFYEVLIDISDKLVSNYINEVVLINIVLSILTMICLYVFTRITIGRLGSAVTILLYAIMPFDILNDYGYSPELLTQAVFFLIIMLCAVLFDKCDISNKKSIINYVLSIIIASLCGVFFYMSPLGAALLVAIFVFYQFKGWLTSIVYTVVLTGVICTIFYCFNISVPILFYNDYNSFQSIWNNFTLVHNDASIYNVTYSFPQLNNQLISDIMSYVLSALYIFLCLSAIISSAIMFVKKRSCIQVLMLSEIITVPFVLFGSVGTDSWSIIILGMIMCVGYNIHYILGFCENKTEGDRVEECDADSLVETDNGTAETELVAQSESTNLPDEISENELEAQSESANLPDKIPENELEAQSESANLPDEISENELEVQSDDMPKIHRIPPVYENDIASTVEYIADDQINDSILDEANDTVDIDNTEETIQTDILPDDYNIYDELPIPRAVNALGESDDGFTVKNYQNRGIDSDDIWLSRKKRAQKRIE